MEKVWKIFGEQALLGKCTAWTQSEVCMCKRGGYLPINDHIHKAREVCYEDYEKLWHDWSFV